MENISKRTPLGSTLNSAEWATVPPEIRMRALFSAKVEEERYLVSMQDKLEQRVRLARENGTGMDRSRFIAEMQDDLAQFGYEPDPRKRGSIEDISSAGRLSLIWDMNLAQAEGYAAWKMGMDPDMLDAAPAQELIRLANRVDKRPWPAIWRQHGGKFYGEPSADYPSAPGRMIALKTDPIWSAISEFGSPWPPYRWGSGMGLRNVRRREAEKLGVLAEGATVKPLDIPFNHNVDASTKGLGEHSLENLRSAFGDQIRIDNEKIKFTPTAANETIEEYLQTRARDIATRGADTFDGVRSEDNAFSLPSSLGSPETEQEILASTSAVAVGRKLLYHEEWGAFAESIASILRRYLPDSVTVALIDGHVYAYRHDILHQSLDKIHELSLAGENGRLLGYGTNMFEHETVAVAFVVKGKVLGGFYAPKKNAIAFIRARRKDFTEALGNSVQVVINGREVDL